MKQKRQIVILVILLGGAAIVWAWNFHDKRVVTADASSNLQDGPPIIQVQNPHIRMEQIDRARSAEYKGSGRNPFSPTAAPASAAAAARVAQQAEKQFPIYDLPQPKPIDPPPPAPVLPPNVKFYGYGSGGPKGPSRRAYFYDGDDEHILGEGDVLLKRFRIIRIGNDHIEFEDINTHRVGTAPIEAEAPPGQPQ